MNHLYISNQINIDNIPSKYPLTKERFSNFIPSSCLTPSPISKASYLPTPHSQRTFPTTLRILGSNVHREREQLEKALIPLFHIAASSFLAAAVDALEAHLIPKSAAKLSARLISFLPRAEESRKRSHIYHDRSSRRRGRWAWSILEAVGYSSLVSCRSFGPQGPSRSTSASRVLSTRSFGTLVIFHWILRGRFDWLPRFPKNPTLASVGRRISLTRTGYPITGRPIFLTADPISSVPIQRRFDVSSGSDFEQTVYYARGN